MCAFLREREPDFSFGHSILVYHLDEIALEKYLHGPTPHEMKLGDLTYVSGSLSPLSDEDLH
jgi:hypothetical protein